MPDPLQTQFDVTVDGNRYTFRMPTIKHDIEVGYKAADIRQRAYPDAGGTMGGIDMNAVMMSRYAAYLELYLISATTGWPFGLDDSAVDSFDFSKAPKIEFEKLPLDCSDDVVTVGQAFEAAVQRFRNRRNKSGTPAGA